MEVIIAENIRLFEEAISSLTPELKKILMNVKDDIKCNCKEIRLKSDKPVVLYYGTKYGFLMKDSSIGVNVPDAYKCTKIILNDTYTRMCGYSVHAHHYDIIKGFITLTGGHRVGVVGAAAVDSSGNILSLRDISSLNIRISREIEGCADEIIYKIKNTGFIIVGPPSSGKTTVLRDCVRQISDSGKKVSLIDERNEIACMMNGLSYKNVGINTDVFSSYPKETAINIALRTMSPDYIAVDEVCEEKEISSIVFASNCGVKFIVTVHAADFFEIVSRKLIISLLESGAFEKIVLLDKNPEFGVSGIYDVSEIMNEISGRNSNLECHRFCGL